MNELIEDVGNQGGIYIILNIMDCKAYVGQADDFNKRTHVDVLEQGKDNSELQKVYDEKDRDLIYFVVGNVVEHEDKATRKSLLDTYEKLFMTIVEEMGYSLYNHNIKRDARTIEQLNLDKKDYNEAKNALIEDFLLRFNITPEELCKGDDLVKQHALEFYASKRLEKENKEISLFRRDRFFFNRTRINDILGTQERSICQLDLSEMFISKAGQYIGESLDQILNYKVKTIKDNKYCLWAFSDRAVSTEKVRQCCREREKKGKDTYVLFSFTPSEEYADKSSYKYSCLKKGVIKSIYEDEVNFLKLQIENKKRCIVPEEVACTGASESGVDAFVFEEIFLLKENMNENELREKYMAVGKSNLYELPKSTKYRSTFYVQRKDLQEKIDYEKLCVESKHRSICFVGKLKAPYILSLKQD